MIKGMMEVANILEGFKVAERECYACNNIVVVLVAIPPEKSGLMMTGYRPVPDITHCGLCLQPLTDRIPAAAVNGQHAETPRRRGPNRPKEPLALPPPSKPKVAIRQLRKQKKDDAPTEWQPKLPGLRINGRYRTDFVPYGNRCRQLDDGMYEWTQDYGDKVLIDPNEEIGSESLIKNYLGYTWRPILAEARQMAVLKYRKEKVGMQTRFWIKGSDFIDLLKEIDRIGAEMQTNQKDKETEE